MTDSVVLSTTIKDLGEPRRGKVRDIYETQDHLLIVATDRVSAFDVVLLDGIPGKGRVLTRLSRYWFEQVGDLVPHHLISVDVDDFPAACQPYRTILAGRTMLVRKAEPLPVECVVRGYLAGSAWREYQAGGTVCGIPLPPGLSESAQLVQPIFTPSSKAPLGKHDENIGFQAVEGLIGSERARQVRELSLALYRRAQPLAREKGFILADTKFEFGLQGGRLMLIDELFTPDSSRFWWAEAYRPGTSPDSHDKQIIRDYLLTLDWDQRPPAPPLPPDVIRRAAGRYQEICRILTGEAA